MKRFCLILLTFLVLAIPSQSFARDNITDWYIKNFESEIVVNKDSSLTITEKITADCDNLPDKHGIFRILPAQIYRENNQKIKTPITLISITDFNDKPVNYSQTKSTIDHTITWKIGDPDVVVKNENYYKIKYKVENAIIFDNPKFDEFYWNLNGNFWEIETDNFTANITFPSEVSQTDSYVSQYTGSFGSKNNDLAKYEWTADNIIKVSSLKTFKQKEGVTISITAPKHIFTPYVPNFWERNGKYFYPIIPLFILLLSLYFWSKYGRDPKINPTIAPEFSIPENLSPLEMGLVLSDGTLKTQYISAEIINLAVKGIIKIEKIAKKGVFSHEDYKLTLLKTVVSNLLTDKLFGNQKEVTISSLKNKFYENIPSITKETSKKLAGKELLVPRSRKFHLAFLIMGFVFLGFSPAGFTASPYLALSLFISAIILFVFSFLMKQRTKKGAETLRQILGFKLYMETAEKYRQRFNEKENIFERFLPYAIMFGITELWIKKIKQIYGADYYATYHPVWFYGATVGAFDMKGLNSAISGLSSSMASTLASSPSSSGAGGGGFAGGGGGGGGGGGW
ncbi:MAG: DUF2207 domain-containing protein [Candidatus Berkelbacteria bacterium]|nr:DUF2207 domain-containing protein [Candidatus Berkelbacteria bacterium]